MDIEKLLSASYIDAMYLKSFDPAVLDKIPNNLLLIAKGEDQRAILLVPATALLNYSEQTKALFENLKKLTSGGKLDMIKAMTGLTKLLPDLDKIGRPLEPEKK
jgi:hypothetical protein